MPLSAICVGWVHSGLPLSAGKTHQYWNIHVIQNYVCTDIILKYVLPTGPISTLKRKKSPWGLLSSSTSTDVAKPVCGAHRPTLYELEHMRRLFYNGVGYPQQWYCQGVHSVSILPHLLCVDFFLEASSFLPASGEEGADLAVKPCMNWDTYRSAHVFSRGQGTRCSFSHVACTVYGPAPPPNYPWPPS